MNETLKKRLLGGMWIILAGTVAEVLTLVLDNLADFNLDGSYEAILKIALTGAVAMITKQLNSK